MYAPVLHRLDAIEDILATPVLAGESWEILKKLPDLERLLRKYVSLSSGASRSASVQSFLCVPLVQQLWAELLLSWKILSSCSGQIYCVHA